MGTPADLVEAGLEGSQFIGALAGTASFVLFVLLCVGWARRAGAQA